MDPAALKGFRTDAMYEVLSPRPSVRGVDGTPPMKG
jgi:hypothetical protein